MAHCIIIAANWLIHRMVVMTIMMSRAERAVWIMVVMPIAVIPIQMRCNAIVRTPPTWPIAPVVRRVPCHPCRSPEPIIYHWTVDIYRLNNIVRTIYIFVAYHLHSDLLLLILLHIDRSYILIDILCQHRLNHYQVAIIVSRFYHTQVIHFTIAIEVEVGESRVWVIEQRLKCL